MAVIALMEDEFVRRRRLVSADEFVHGVGLGQILGSFAVNTSVFLGYRLFGAMGAVLAAAVFLIPSIALVTLLSELYFRYHTLPALQGTMAGLGPVAIALIVAAAWSIGRKVIRSWPEVLVAIAALAAGLLRLNAVWILFAAGAVGFLISRRRPVSEQPPPAARSGPRASLTPDRRCTAQDNPRRDCPHLSQDRRCVLWWGICPSACLASPACIRTWLVDPEAVSGWRCHRQSDTGTDRRPCHLCRVQGWGHGRRPGGHGCPVRASHCPDARNQPSVPAAARRRSDPTISGGSQSGGCRSHPERGAGTWQGHARVVARMLPVQPVAVAAREVSVVSSPCPRNRCSGGIFWIALMSARSNLAMRILPLTLLFAPLPLSKTRECRAWQASPQAASRERLRGRASGQDGCGAHSVRC